MIKTSLSGLGQPVHLGTYKQYIQYLSLLPRDWYFLFTCAVIHCDIETLQNQS